MFKSNTIKLNKLIGLICAALLLIGSLYVPMSFYAKADEVNSETVVTFENYPHKIFGRALNTMSIKNSEKAGFDDDYALNFNYDGDAIGIHNGAEYQLNTRAISTDNFALIANKVEDNTLYRVTYMRKAGENCQSDFKIKFATAQSSNIFGGYAECSDSLVQVASDDKEWVKEVVYFTTKLKGEAFNALFILFNSADPSADAFVDAYVDNVTVEAVTGNVLFLNYNNTNIANDIIKGKIGDAITLPTPTDSRCEFLGWYADAELTVPFTATTLAEGFTYAYAKWSDPPITFENYEYTIANRSVYTMFIRKGDKLGFDDNYALNFYYDGDAEYEYKGTTYKFFERARSTDNGVVVAQKVTPNTLYKVSYMRKAADDCQSDFKIIFATANISNVYGGYSSYADSSVSISATDTEWVKEELYFFTKETIGKGYDALYLMINSADSTANAFVNAYIDNVSVEAISGPALFIHSNIPSIKNNVISGIAGNSFELPTLTDSRCDFLGWYADAELTVPFTATTFDEGITNVYAKWSAIPITFENYEYPITGRAQYSIFINKGDGIGIDDNYAAHFVFDASKSYEYNGTTFKFHERINSIDSYLIIGKVVPNAVYKITYYRKSGSKAKNGTEIIPATGNGSNVWAPQFKQYPSNTVVVDTKDKEWIKEEIFVSPTFTDPAANALFLMFYSADRTENARADVYVDNVRVEKVEPPYVFFEYNNDEGFHLSQGEAGEKIDFPATPTNFGYSFTGWYTDAECTEKFTAETYAADTAITVYAGWKPATTITYTFEKYDIPHRGESHRNMRRDGHVISFNKALSGNKVLAFDRTKPLETLSSYAAIAYKDKAFTAKEKTQYIVTVNYYIKKAPSTPFSLSLSTGHPDNYWAVPVIMSSVDIDINVQSNKWHSTTLLVDANKLTDIAYNALYLRVNGGEEGIIYIDNVVISAVPAGHSVVVINSQDSKDVPAYITGKPGSSFAKKLPENPKNGDKVFKGYYILSADGSFAELKREDMKFADTAFIVYARFLERKVVQDFDNNAYHSPFKKYKVMSTFDFDYRVYDSEAEGNSKDNVTSGRYSLHRLGNSVHYENALVLNTTDKIAEGERYTVSFKVKMGKYSHTNGAIKVVSSRNYVYAWSTTGDYYPVVAINDLTDGQWHEVSYTFNSVESYASIQTPGGVELFIDDVTFTLANDVPLSTPVTYTEYVSSQQDENKIDVSTIIDLSLDDNGIAPWIIIIICVGAVIILGGITLIIIKSNKSKKA